MKVHISKGIKGYSGASDGVVYYYHPKMQLCLAREYVVPDNKPNTDRTKAIMANLKLIMPSAAYKQNFKDYLYGYNDLKEHRDKPALSWYNLYIRMLFALQETVPGVSLLTLSRAQIYAENLPCKTVAAAVEAGLMPSIPYYERLTQEI
jgi:hypothetical protein